MFLKRERDLPASPFANGTFRLIAVLSPPTADDNALGSDIQAKNRCLPGQRVDHLFPSLVLLVTRCLDLATLLDRHPYPHDEDERGDNHDDRKPSWTGSG